MNINTKKLTVMGLFTGLVVSLGVAFGGSQISARANGNVTYYHYVGREATASQCGIKEYWTDCTNTYFSTEDFPVAGTIVEAPWENPEDKIGTITPDSPYYVAPLIAASTPAPQEEEIKSVTIINDSGKADTMGGGGSSEESSGPIVVDQHGNDTGLIIEEVGNNNGGSSSSQNEEEYTVVGYKGEDEVLIIPEGIVSIDTWNSHPFDGNNNENVNNLTTIIIPETVNELTVTAFENMDNLETLVIGAKVLNYGCISNCPKLKYIYITANCETILSTPFRTSGSQDIKIFCEAPSKPAGWCDDWNISTYNSWPHPRYDTSWSIKY